MNKITPWVLLLVCLHAACSSAQKTSHLNKSKEGHYQRQKQIVWKESTGNYAVNIEEGDQLVFELNSASGGDPRNDSQIKSGLIFSIDPKLKAFDYDLDLTTKHHTFFLRSCRCLDVGYNKIISGQITGKLAQDGAWHLEIDVKALGNDSNESYHFAFIGIAKEQ